MSSLHIGVHCFHAIDEESCREFVHTLFWEGGGFATFWTGEGLFNVLLWYQTVEALLAVVVKARKYLGISVVLVTDGTRDLLFQVLYTFHNHSFFPFFSHYGLAKVKVMSTV